MNTITAVALAGALLLSGACGAAEIKVLSTQATEEAYRELVPQFEKQSGHKVSTVFTGTLDVQRRIAAGETFDLIIMAGPAIDDYIKAGKIAAGSRVDLAKSGVGVAVRAGTHCVMPLLARFGVSATCRASFAMYNTREEIDCLAQALVKAQEFFT